MLRDWPGFSPHIKCLCESKCGQYLKEVWPGNANDRICNLYLSDVDMSGWYHRHMDGSAMSGPASSGYNECFMLKKTNDETGEIHYVAESEIYFLTHMENEEHFESRYYDMVSGPPFHRERLKLSFRASGRLFLSEDPRLHMEMD